MNLLPRATTTNFRRWFAAVMVAVLFVSLAVWWYKRVRVPDEIIVATGDVEGLYNEVGDHLVKSMGTRLRSRVAMKATAGSHENFSCLQDGSAHLAIVQGGAVEMDRLSIITPLFPEYVFVIVRADRDIQGIRDLAGRNVALGDPKSGSRESATKVLEHFDVDVGGLGKKDATYTQFANDPSIDAAIVTAGIRHRGLFAMLGSDAFRLLPIKTAAALEMTSPFYYSAEIPAGLFAAAPSMLPGENLTTVATTAYLVAGEGADLPNQVIIAALEAIHEESLRLTIPSLISRADAMQYVPTKLYLVAYRYFNPTDDIGHLAAVMESLAATKELMFALGAGLYLLWLRWRQLREREANEAIRRQKDRLDRFLNQTLQIEQAQTKTDDARQLREYLDQVTQIKLRALRELTEEELRGDQAFAIFLAQCANLISKMQFKILISKPESGEFASQSSTTE